MLDIKPALQDRVDALQTRSHNEIRQLMELTDSSLQDATQVWWYIEMARKEQRIEFLERYILELKNDR
jgi:hypothetical protein